MRCTPLVPAQLATRRRARSAAYLGLALLAAAVALPSTARGQAGAAPTVSGLDIQHFRPAMGPWDGVVVPSAQVAGHLSLSGGLLLNYARRPLIFESLSDGQLLRSIVDNRVQGDAFMAFGLIDRLELGLSVPVSLYQDGSGGSPIGEGDVGAFGIGDVRLRAKMLLREFTEPGLSLGLLLDISLPSGDETDFFGEGTTGWGPSLLLTHARSSHRAMVQLGYRFREAQEIYNLDLDDELFYRAGVELPLVQQKVELLAELYGSLLAKDPFDSQDVSPLEFILGNRYRVWKALTLTLGFGFGLIKGYGTPEYRIFAGAAWSPRVSDRDGDGIVDREDQCPDDPEDLDGFEDTDGCPDLDNDKDGILDPDDQCPNDPEDKDGFEDANGCPDPDNDKDGILDPDDQCPNEAEDKDGFEDANGCPDPDNDGDGILDVDDKCPNEPEDKDGWQDADGCPDPDNDNDKILDVDDKCPNEPETVNGKDDEDGCPDEGDVVLEDKEIRILKKVHFDFNRATIKPESFGILSAVAEVLKKHPELRLVRIEGHTDSVGAPAYNLQLSQRRALAVLQHLLKLGIGSNRLVAQGFGKDQPIDSNETAEGRSQNRRVQFIIVDRAKEAR